MSNNRHFDSAAARKYAKGLVARLNSKYDLGVEVIFRNDLRGGHYNTKTKQINVGWKVARASFLNGFNEYKTVDPFLTKFYGMRSERGGMLGIHLIILHEFAHALQVEDGGLSYGSVHNSFFIRRYVELLESFPFVAERSLDENPLFQQLIAAGSIDFSFLS